MSKLNSSRRQFSMSPPVPLPRNVSNHAITAAPLWNEMIPSASYRTTESRSRSLAFGQLFLYGSVARNEARQGRCLSLSYAARATVLT